MMRVYTRPQTSWSALKCEQAEGPVCHCRCGGALHGKNHDEFLRAVNGLIKQQGDVTDEEIQDILVDLEQVRQ